VSFSPLVCAFLLRHKILLLIWTDPSLRLQVKMSLGKTVIFVFLFTLLSFGEGLSVTDILYKEGCQVPKVSVAEIVLNQTMKVGRLRLKCDGTRAETTFRLSTKWTSPFKSAGASVQSTTGSRGVRISRSNTGCTIFLGSVKSTDSPLHSPVSPSFPLPCVTVCHHISTGLYKYWRPHDSTL
jgi:hypothetical protein